MTKKQRRDENIARRERAEKGRLRADTVARDRSSPGMEFYRCITCQGVVSKWDIDVGGCPKCGQTKIRPSNLTILEKLVQVWKHPAIWKWSDV